MTIKDLNNANDPTRQMKMCFDSTNCIQLPDKNGNLYLTAPNQTGANAGANAGQIQMDAPTLFSKPAILKDKFNIIDANNNVAASMYAMPNSASSTSPFMRVNSKGTSFGSQEVTPSAVVHITTDGLTNPLRVQISNSSMPYPVDCFLVDNTGNVTIGGNLKVGGNIIQGTGITTGTGALLYATGGTPYTSPTTSTSSTSTTLTTQPSSTFTLTPTTPTSTTTITAV